MIEMIVGIEKVLWASAPIGIVSGVLAYSSNSIVIELMWVSAFLAAVSILGSWFDIYASKNEKLWKITWAAVAFIPFFGAIAYLHFARKDRI